MSVIQYNGNPNLKHFGVQLEFTPEQIQEYIKCKDDPIYFIKNYCKIVSLDEGLIPFELYDFQEEFIEKLNDKRFLIGLMPRQSGKTQTVAAFILHFSLFNNNKTIAILANKASAAREILSRYQLMYENIPMFLQQGIAGWNKGDVELENGSTVFTAATSASGIRGKSVNFLYIDEASIIPNNVAEEFFTSTYPTISAGKTTKICMTSTPLGLNHFWKFWAEAESNVNGFYPFRVHYWQHPERDEKWADEQRKLLGELKFNQEVLCEFIGSSDTLISASSQMKMNVETPIYSKNNIDIYEYPVKGKYVNNSWEEKPGAYVICVDTSDGCGGDNSTFTIIKVDELPYKVVAKYKDNAISPLLFPNIIYKWAMEYNEAFVLIEINKSEQIPHILYQELEYENILFVKNVQGKGQQLCNGFGSKTFRNGVIMDKKVKRIGCDMLKTLIEEDNLIITDADIISEISTFIKVKSSYEADTGKTDDLIMTLVVFGWLSSQPYFQEVTDIDLRKQIYDARISEMDAEELPLGYFNDGIKSDEENVWQDVPIG